MYEQVLNIVNWIIIALLIISAIILIYKIFYHLYALMPAIKFPEEKKQHKFAILIPARNESAVIEGLLLSLKEQDYPKEMFDTYVIVESNDDPTVKICEKYENVYSFVRPDLKVKSKGGALDHVLKHLINSGIAEQKQYEAYFIFDADNTIKSNFLTEMNKTFDAGYDIALSYRNSKNWNDGWVASCSALTFSMLNTFQNKCRARFTKNVLVSGTGFYISAKVINQLKGWPFQTLTEDVEISNYAVLNNLKGAYNENTEFFDEQPVSLKISWNQRIRWVKGNMQVKKKYSKQLMESFLISKENRLGKLEFAVNVIPIAIPLISIIIYSLTMLIMGIVGVCLNVETSLWQMAFINFGGAIFGIYLFFACYTLIMLLIERKHINITLKNAIKTVIMNPFFMGLYLPIFVCALFKKEVKWKPIERKCANLTEKENNNNNETNNKNKK